MLPSSGGFRYAHIWQKCAIYKQVYLYGLSETSLPEDFSVDEVRRAEDAVSLVGDDAERLRPVDVLPV